ncbi:MAG: hypothetical protein NC916_00795, partial [Candidatus Omnitrophica bacterium]|nr:hypothetical protein [Candidatus Omnitrophota bacterium]
MAYYTWKSFKLKLSAFEIFKALAKGENIFFLDSSLKANSSGRYSFLGIDPFYVFRASGRNPFRELRALFEKYRISPKSDLPPFVGGAVGFLSYDLGFVLENKLSKRTVDDLHIPDCTFLFYNTIIIIDNLKKELCIFLTGFPEKTSSSAKALCRANLKKMEKLLSKTGTGEGISKQV